MVDRRFNAPFHRHQIAFLVTSTIRYTSSPNRLYHIACRIKSEPNLRAINRAYLSWSNKSMLPPRMPKFVERTATMSISLVLTRLWYTKAADITACRISIRWEALIVILCFIQSLNGTRILAAYGSRWYYHIDATNFSLNWVPRKKMSPPNTNSQWFCRSGPARSS